MKKTILAAAVLGAATLSMAAPAMAEGDYKVAMVTDSGDITDQSFTRLLMKRARHSVKRMVLTSTTTNQTETLTKHVSQAVTRRSQTDTTFWYFRDICLQHLL